MAGAVDDHGGNANGLRWTLSQDRGWLVGRAPVRQGSSGSSEMRRLIWTFEPDRRTSSMSRRISCCWELVDHGADAVGGVGDASSHQVASRVSLAEWRARRVGSQVGLTQIPEAIRCSASCWRMVSLRR